MTSDMESLSRAEEELQHLMSKLQQKDSKIESNEAALQQQQQQLDSTDVMEVSRLREQASANVKFLTTTCQILILRSWIPQLI